MLVRKEWSLIWAITSKPKGAKGRLVIGMWLSGAAVGAWCGCRGYHEPIAEVTQEQVVLSPAQRYGRLSPRELDTDLTDEQLARMYMSLEDIPTVPLWEGEAQVGPPIGLGPAGGRVEVGKVEGGKAYLRGRRLFDEGRHQEAIEQIKTGLQADPNSAALYEILAKAYMNSGESEAAAEAAKKSLLLDAQRLIPYRILGLNSLAKGQEAQAVAIFRRALLSSRADEGNPTTGLLRLRLAQVLSGMGYTSAAVEQYGQAYKWLNRQSGYSHDSALVQSLTRQRHLPLLTMAGLQLSMGEIAGAARAVQEAQEQIVVQVDLMKAFFLYLAERRIGLQTRYRQVTALCGYLLLTEYQMEETLSSYYLACQKMAKHDDYFDSLNRWYQADAESKEPPLLSARWYAYGLSLGDRDEQAEQVLREELKRAKPEALVHRDLGRLYGKLGRGREMIQEYGAYIESDAEASQAVTEQLAEQASRMERLGEMLESSRSDEELSGSYGSSFLLGYLAQKSGQMDLAEQYYQGALSVCPEMAAGREALIELWLQRGKNEKVLEWIEKNVGMATTDAQWLWCAGRACTGLRNYPRAAQYLQRVLELRKDDKKAYLSLGDIWAREGNYVQAEKMLLRVLSYASSEPQVYLEMMSLYFRWAAQHEVDEDFRESARARARLMLRRWLRYGGDKSDNTALWESQRWGKAVNRLEELAEKYPLDKGITLMLGSLYHARGSNEQALELIKPLREKDPADEEALTLAGQIYEKMGDWEQAGQLRQQIWQHHREDAYLLLEALRTMRQAGQVSEAWELLLSAAQQPGCQNAQTIMILRQEAYRLAALSRRYAQAAGLFEKWYWLGWTAEQEGAVVPAEEESGAVPAQEESGAESAQEESGAELTEEESGAVPAQEEESLGRWSGSKYIWALTEAQFYERAIQQGKGYNQRFHPNEPRAALYLARNLNIRLRYSESCSFLEDLLKVQPDNQPLRVQYYLTMQQMGRSEQALVDAEAWLAQEPNDPQRQNQLVFLMRRMGDYDGAVRQLTKYLDQQPRNEQLRLNLFNTLLQGGNYEEAQAILSALDESERQKSLRLDALVRIDIAQGICASALARIDEFTAGRESPGIAQLKVQVWASCGNLEKATELLEEIIRKDPQDIDSRVRYSNYLQRLGRQDEALRENEALLESYPDNGQIKNNLGYSLLEAHQDMERACRLIKESLEADPQSAPTLDSLGWFYYKKGQFGIAREYIYQAAAQTALPDAEILDHLGDTMYRLGHRQEARHYWQQVRNDLKRRAVLERYLKTDLEKIEKKLEQLAAQEEVTVAPCGSGTN